MNKIFQAGMIMAITACMIFSGTVAGKTRDTEAIRTILSNYTPWTNVEFSGKLHYEKLPVKPTVKIYMEKDELIQISLRAPLVGEVGRIEMTRDSLLAVNKMNKTYCRESLDRIEQTLPGALSYVQSFLLGRVIVPGRGELDASNAAAYDFITDTEGGWMLVPSGNSPTDIVGASYGYSISPQGRTRALLVNVDGKGISAGAIYDYTGGGVSISLSVDTPRKDIAGSIDFDSVKWGGKRMSPVNLGGKYRQTGIRQFVSSF